MKVFRKSLFSMIALLCILGGCFVAYGIFWIDSNPLTVNVQYAATLSTVSIVGSQITLQASVTNGAAYGAGLVVDFYYSTNGGVDWTYFASSTTDSGGIAQATFVAQQNGAYDFKATVTIP